MKNHKIQCFSQSSFLTNKFGRHFSYMDKYVKSKNQISQHHKTNEPSFRNVSPIPSLGLTERSNFLSTHRSSSSLDRSSLSVSSFLLERQKRK